MTACASSSSTATPRACAASAPARARHRRQRHPQLDAPALTRGRLAATPLRAAARAGRRTTPRWHWPTSDQAAWWPRHAAAVDHVDDRAGTCGPTRRPSDNEQAAQRHEIQFWKTRALPAACLVMMALALPFRLPACPGGGISLKGLRRHHAGHQFVLLNNMAGHLGLLRLDALDHRRAPSRLFLLVSLAPSRWCATAEVDAMPRGPALFAHGARDPLGAADSRPSRLRIRAQLRDHRSGAGLPRFHEPRCIPDIEIWLAAPAARHDIGFALFLGAGGHVQGCALLTLSAGSMPIPLWALRRGSLRSARPL